MLSSIVAQALPESKFHKIEQILTQKNHPFYQGSFFEGHEVGKIRYIQFGRHKGAKGSVVILPGHRESSLDWIEWAYDLLQQGYSPVWALDHSGQGLSDRALVDHRLAHVHTYKSYYIDVKNWFQLIQAQASAHKNLYLITHSMGSLIGMYYLSHEFSPFKAVVMMSPMFKKHPILLGGTEGVLHHFVKLACAIGRCFDYAYRGDRAPPLLGQLNPLTGSPVRYRFVSWLRKRFPSIQTSGASNQWLLLSIEQARQLRAFDFSNTLMPPMLLFYGSQDFVVSSSASSKLCQKWVFCTPYKVKGGKHGLHIEKDKLRQDVLRRTLQFFNQNT